MKIFRTIVLLVLASVVTSALAQSWSAAYDQGLRAARAQQWAEARDAFQQAAAYRPEDVATATTLPGPVTEQRRWRGGAPYSPNFLAAYAGYRQALEMTGGGEQTGLMRKVAEELETLLAKGQNSRESFFYLDRIYSRLNDTERRRALEERLAAFSGRTAFRVDTEVVDPQDVALIASTPATGQQPGAPVIIQAGQPIRPLATAATTVAGTTTKYALIIGNSESQGRGGELPFAAEDAHRVRDSLVLNAGYTEANVDLVVNATAMQILSSARALAERIPNNATVLIYFTGTGANIDGKDFLAGVDTALPTDIGSMVSKADLFRHFMGKGSQIFAFFQVNRPILGGRFFGMEVPMVGAVAQIQATLPGENVHAINRDGQRSGVFTTAFCGVLDEMRSNAIPINEFGWQVFYRMRRGDTGSTGGGSMQTPTLPVVTNMASDARF
jgi:hypothetical protein